jgi:hypothetical protein
MIFLVSCEHLSIDLKSAFVGFTSIIVLLPAPGYFAAKLQVVQRKKMTMVSLTFLDFLPLASSNSWK